MKRSLTFLNKYPQIVLRAPKLLALKRRNLIFTPSLENFDILNFEIIKIIGFTAIAQCSKLSLFRCQPLIQKTSCTYHLWKGTLFTNARSCQGRIQFFFLGGGGGGILKHK